MSSSVLCSFSFVPANSIRANQALRRQRTSPTNASSPSRRVGPFHARMGSSFWTSSMRPSPMLTYHRRPLPSVTRFIVKEMPPALLLNRPSSLHRQNQRHLLVRERMGFLHLLRLAYLFSPPPLATKPHQPILLGPLLSTFPRSSMSTDGL